MKYKVNISIDDVSPHPLSSVKVLKQCYNLIEEFEDIKFTLFVPIAYWRTLGDTATPEPLFINKYPEFCQYIRDLPSKNFEIGYHGYHHGIPRVTNNDEFWKLDFNAADHLFKLMFSIVEESNLQNTFKLIFRPPAWKMSQDAIKAAKVNNIEILALSPKIDYGEKYDKIVYYNCNPPFDPLSLHEKTGIVYHACEWDRNYLNEIQSKKLESLLKENIDDIEFCFIEELL